MPGKVQEIPNLNIIYSISKSIDKVGQYYIYVLFILYFLKSVTVLLFSYSQVHSPSGHFCLRSVANLQEVLFKLEVIYRAFHLILHSWKIHVSNL